jgi:hypothetical protein
MSLLAVRRLAFRRPAAISYSTFTQKEIDPQLNGYPQLPNDSKQSSPPHGWWDIQMRRNFGDTVQQKVILHRTCAKLVTDARARRNVFHVGPRYPPRPSGYSAQAFHRRGLWLCRVWFSLQVRPRARPACSSTAIPVRWTCQGIGGDRRN